MTPAERFAVILRRLRDEKQLTRGELAARSGLSVHVIRSYESGLRQPAWDSLNALARGLRVRLDRLADSPPAD